MTREASSVVSDVFWSDGISVCVSRFLGRRRWPMEAAIRGLVFEWKPASAKVCEESEKRQIRAVVGCSPI